MSLAEYAGPANSNIVFPFLVGEQIVGAFRDHHDGSAQIVLVLASGFGFVINDNGSYWHETQQGTERRVQRRRAELDARIDEMRLLNAGVPGGSA